MSNTLLRMLSLSAGYVSFMRPRGINVDLMSNVNADFMSENLSQDTCSIGPVASSAGRLALSLRLIKVFCKLSTLPRLLLLMKFSESKI